MINFPIWKFRWKCFTGPFEITLLPNPLVNANCLLTPIHMSKQNSVPNVYVAAAIIVSLFVFIVLAFLKINTIWKLFSSKMVDLMASIDAPSNNL